MIAAVLFTPALKVGSSLPASRGAVSRVSALEMAATTVRSRHPPNAF